MNLLDRLAKRRGLAANAGLAAVFAALAAAEGYGLAHRPGPQGGWPFSFAVGVAVCVAALLRERGRAQAAAAGLLVAGAAEAAAMIWKLPGQPGIAATAGLMVLVGSAARTLPLRPAAGIAAGGAVIAAVAMVSHPDVADAIRSAWGAVLAAGLGLRVLDARRRAAVESIRREERLQLARELHDSAAHHLTGTVIQAQAARIAAGQGGDVLDDALAGIESASSSALASMRRVIGLLRDSGDAGPVTPGPEDLATLIDRFAGRGPRAVLRLPDGPPDPAWPPEVQTTIYRAVQESLTNVARHAPGAAEVTVTLAHDTERITVEIADDAPATVTPLFSGSGGFGLIGMRERVEALGGTLAAGPGQRGGWSVTAVLPGPGA